MDQLFEQLKELSHPGIYLLTNLADNTSVLYQSSNISRDLINKIDSTLFFPEYKFELVEIVTDQSYIGKIIRLVKLNYYIAYYSNKGYNIVNQVKNSFKVRIDVLQDFRDSVNHHVLFYVKVCCRGYKDVTVGVFETYREVEEFVKKYYCPNIVTLVFSESHLSKEYFRL